MSDEPMGILEQRRIEAGVIKPIYEQMKAELGLETAQRILGDAIKKAAVRAGMDFAANEAGETTLTSFAALMPLWTKGDALQIRVINQAEDRLEFDVTRCRYAEMYSELGLGEIGHLLSCNRDGHFCDGYDPRIKLTRTQTIMQGASYCDFRYRLDR